MFCPICRSEYREGIALCADCNVELVSALPELRNGPIERVWRSGDPVAVSQAIAALREAGIQHHVKATNDHFVFELGIPRPKYEIRVFESDAQAARRLIADIPETLPFSLSEEEPSVREDAPGEMERQPAAAAAKPCHATFEIWSGEDAGLAQILEDCLRENRIAVRREGVEPGTLRLFVLPADADSGREILRELREGTPPA